jgi:hypothetical protein
MKNKKVGRRGFFSNPTACRRIDFGRTEDDSKKDGKRRTTGTQSQTIPDVSCG